MFNNIRNIITLSMIKAQDYIVNIELSQGKGLFKTPSILFNVVFKECNHGSDIGTCSTFAIIPKRAI